MSYGARLAIAITALVGGAAFLAIGLTHGSRLPAGAAPFYGMAFFCALVVVACMWRASRPLALRLIGAPVFLLYVANVYARLNTDELSWAITGFIVFGLPAAYVTVYGRYPPWGRFAAVFNGDAGNIPKDDLEESRFTS